MKHAFLVSCSFRRSGRIDTRGRQGRCATNRPEQTQHSAMKSFNRLAGACEWWCRRDGETCALVVARLTISSNVVAPVQEDRQGFARFRMGSNVESHGRPSVIARASPIGHASCAARSFALFLARGIATDKRT